MKRRGKIAIGVSAAVVVVGLTGWSIAANAEAGSVLIAGDSRPMVCAQGQAVDRETGGIYYEYATLPPSLDCTLRIHVYNNGMFPVTLTSAHFLGLGKSSRLVTVDIVDGALAVNHGYSASGQLSGPLQAVTEIDPGEGTTFTVHIIASKHVCMSPGASSEGLQPTLSFTTLGVTESREPTELYVGFIGTKSSECQ